MLNGVINGLGTAVSRGSWSRETAAEHRSSGEPTQANPAESITPEGDGTATVGQQDLASSEARELQQLKARDREVRQHEQAHMAAGGQYVKGGPNFSYQTGPDGRQYAVGGEVQIDTSAVRGDPEATLRKMEAVRRAAMAPAEPSGQDRAVAAQAAQAAAGARADIQQQRNQGEGGEGIARAGVEAYREGAQQQNGVGELINLTA